MVFGYVGSTFSKLYTILRSHIEPKLPSAYKGLVQKDLGYNCLS